MANAGVPWGQGVTAPVITVVTAAYLAANPSLPDVPNNSIVFVTP